MENMYLVACSGSSRRSGSEFRIATIRDLLSAYVVGLFPEQVAILAQVFAGELPGERRYTSVQDWSARTLRRCLFGQFAPKPRQ
jgi:hypothetical protein